MRYNDGMYSKNRDDNFSVPKYAVLNSDTVQGQHIVPVQIGSNGRILCNTTDTISFTMTPVSPRTKNFLSCWLFQGADGKTYPAVANASGALLVEN
jgi:hypothetical protein